MVMTPLQILREPGSAASLWGLRPRLAVVADNADGLALQYR